MVQLYQNCSTPKLTVQKQDHEEDAIQCFEREAVTKCGLFADQQQLWLATSPDGLVVDVETLEVKGTITGKDYVTRRTCKEEEGINQIILA